MLVRTVVLGAWAVLLGAGGYSALHDHTPKPLPPQVFDMGPYDDVLELQCEELSNYLNFTGSRLKPIVRVSVSCYCDTKNNHCPQAVPYQDLWFAGGEAIGAKQKKSLPVPERDQVAILLKPRLKPLSDAEVTACAAALVRLRLALSLNRNLIVTVRIPAQYVEGFLAELRKQNFLPYQEARAKINVLIPLTLETELGKKYATCFVPPDAH
jgi:hypothetical protein